MLGNSPGNTISARGDARRKFSLSALSSARETESRPKHSTKLQMSRTFSAMSWKLRFAGTAWWARQDSNLQPDRYERMLQCQRRSAPETCQQGPEISVSIRHGQRFGSHATETDLWLPALGGSTPPRRLLARFAMLNSELQMIFRSGFRKIQHSHQRCSDPAYDCRASTQVQTSGDDLEEGPEG
jgi:hypothetical protein